MSGDGRDEPLGGGGTDGGADPGGTHSRQVPNQGGPKAFPGPGGVGGPAGVPEQSGPSGSGRPGGSGRTGGPGGFFGPIVPHPATSPGGTGGAAGAPAEAAGGVPPQREGPGGPSEPSPTDSQRSETPLSETQPAETPLYGTPVYGTPVYGTSPSELPASHLPPSDADLIQRMRDGDDSAYEELFRRHSGAVRRYARSCCRDAHTAEDLTAEVFVRTLQAVRGGAGPAQAVRAYLLTTVRHVAASWTKSAKREQLVDDFAVFAAQAAHFSGASGAGTLALDPGADVRAMREADRSMAMEAFRSLPERWQAVLWHTTVEEESPSEVAPLFGLTPNATAVLAGRAREGLKQAYLQAHVSSALTSGGDCARYADRLGAYARGGLRMRAERGLRQHLEECVKCRLAAGELAHVNAGIPALLPVAVIGWFAAGYSLKAAGIVAGGAAGAAGAGAVATAGGASGGVAASGSGGASGATTGAAAGGIGAPVQAGLAGMVAVAAVAGLVWALVHDPRPAPRAESKPPAAGPVVPPRADPSPEPTAPPVPKPAPPSEKPAPRPTAKPAPAATPVPGPEPTTPAVPEPSAPPDPEPPEQDPSPEPPPPEPPAQVAYQVSQLAYGILGDGSEPEVRLGESGWLWRRSGMSTGGARYGHGVTVHAPSSVTIDLNRRCSSYEARVGVDDLTLGLGSVRFSVYGDGGRLWRSPVLRGGDAAVPVQVGIAGQRTIRLVVEPHTPFDVVALADWAQALITCD
ncbi:sigma-70 family RNA polymerase sigma factor [Streptomyces sp. NPDC058391]|uniref:sigma-70 family RNA polymerase sigma factor n=1 Tax=Streptomyces sp. NPDC058391 TaxID=3346476 RepID=UPI003660588B